MGGERFRYVVGLLAGVALLFALAKFVNVADTIDSFVGYPWERLPLILFVSLAYYLLKAARWHYFLNVLGVRLSWRRSLLLYLAGQWFAFTPAGEFVRAYLLTGYGYSFSQGSAAVTVQVVFDLLSLAIVGSIAIARFPELAVLVLPFTAIFGSAVLVYAYWPLLTKRKRPQALAPRAGGLPLKHRSGFNEYSRQLLDWKPMLVGMALALPTVLVGAAVLFEVSRGFEIGLGLDGAAYVYSISQLVGALSMLPHGLGAIEGSSVALFNYASPGVDTARAASAVVLFRLCTVGWSMVLGGLSMVLLRTSLAGTRAKSQVASGH